VGVSYILAVTQDEDNHISEKKYLMRSNDRADVEKSEIFF